MESKTKTCKLKIAFRLRTSPTRLSPICMKRPLRSLDGRRRAYRANAHQTAQKARSGKISRWENLCQPPWEAPRPPTACALPNFPKSERWKVHINSYPCSGMYRESEIHLLVSNFWNQENQRRQHTHTNSEECLTTQCHVLLWDQKCDLKRGSLAQMPLFLWNVACNKHLLPPSQEIGYNFAIQFRKIVAFTIRDDARSQKCIPYIVLYSREAENVTNRRFYQGEFTFLDGSCVLYNF